MSVVSRSKNGIPPARIDVEVRQMRAGDLERVLEIEKNTFPQPWDRNCFEAEIEGAPVRWPIVAVRKGKVVGYAVAWFVEDEAHLANVAVDAAYRNLGIGSLLIRHVIREARRRGAVLLGLEARRSNLRAIDLYSRFGFRLSWVRKHYYANGEDALEMVLDLRQDAQSGPGEAGDDGSKSD